MSDGELLLAAILAQPDEDTPRLAYADWLEETGDEADQRRADLIRVQVEHAAERLELPWAHPEIDGVTGTVRRGFVEEIELTEEQFLAHAAELFRQHPVTIVFLADKYPFGDLSQSFTWFFVGGHSPDAQVLPELFRESLLAHPLRRPDRRGCAFDGSALAQLALSEVAVNFGRWLADLPPLSLTSVARVAT